MDNAWHMRGVSAETRKQAKVQAAAAGMTLGAWITKLIELAATLPPLGTSFTVETYEPVPPDRPLPEPTGTKRQIFYYDTEKLP